jgi:hypothetical protein
MERNGPIASSPTLGPLGITYYPNEKANMFADYLENQFTSQDQCDENQKQRVETRV